MQQQFDKQIGATRYRVTQFGAMQGRAMLVRILKLAGPGFAAGIGNIAKTKDTAVESAVAGGLSEALYDLCARITSDEFGAILDELAKYTVLMQPGNVEPRLSDLFDTHFAGKYDEMLRWAAFCLEVNYRSFFVDSTGSGLWARLSAMLSASKSPKESTGTSTESPAAKGTTPA